MQRTNREVIKSVALGMRATNRDRFHFWDYEFDSPELNILEEAKALLSIVKSWVTDTESSHEKSFLEDYIDILERVVEDENNQ